jgi:ATP synthase F1 delta subunit
MKHSKLTRFLKNTAFLLINILAVILLTYTISLATNGHEGASGDSSAMIKDFVLKVINFSILALVLGYFLRKPLKKFLVQRRKEVEDAIKGADDSLKSATKEYKTAEEKLKMLTSEIKEITEKMKYEGELEKERIIKRTEQAAQKIKHQTDNTIKREFEIIQKKIKEETIEHTIDTAEEILQKKFKPADQDKIAQKIASEINEVKDIDVFLQSPVSSFLKKKVPLDIDTSKQVSEETMAFIKILLAADDDKRKSLHDIKKAYDSYLSDITEISKAQIYTATDIGEPAVSSITSSLKKAIGKDIEVEVIKDSSIIGGIVTKIGSLVFDASVKTQLENMRENLKNEVG